MRLERVRNLCSDGTLDKWNLKTVNTSAKTPFGKILKNKIRQVSEFFHCKLAPLFKLQ